jgi:hypothetical protein
MSLNKKIGFLLDNGLKPNFVSSLNENKINFLFEKMSKKKETKEQDTGILKVPKGSPAEKKAMDSKQAYIAYENEIKEDEFYTDLSGGITQEPEQGESPDYPGSNRGKTGEQESLEEKFESKAQQGLFWARCNKCKSDDCKWCKMAKEFSKSTSKKQYKDMPEKKHPEKTVKYKKKKTNEEFTMANYLEKLGAAITSKMGQETKGITPVFKESIFEKNLEKIIQDNLRPSMKKKELLQLIEMEVKKNKNISEDFYFGEGEMSENQPAIKEPATKPKTPTEKPKEKPRRKPERVTPYENPETRPQGEDDEFELDMEFSAEPAIKEPATKPKTPTEKPKEKPRRKPERITPYENPETRPQGEDEFDFVMEKLYNRLKKK